MREMFAGSPCRPLRMLLCFLGLCNFANSATAQTATAATPGLYRIVSQQGEVLLDKGGNGAETTAPLRSNATLGKLDELTTNDGRIELASSTGFHVRLSGAGLVALLAPNALYLARGELHIVDQSPAASGQPSAPFFIATPCGRSLIRSREARMRVEGNSTTVSVYDGTVFLGSANANGAGIAAGQSGYCVKGEPLPAPVPILPAPQWRSAGEIIAIGEGSAKASLPLHLQIAVPAPRMRVDLSLIEGDVETPISSAIAVPTHPQIDLQQPAIGRYLARAFALDAHGAIGQQSQPHPFVIVRVAGLAADGSVHGHAGVMPRITVPKGSTFSVLLDGAALSEEKLTTGKHELRIVIAGLSTTLPCFLTGANINQPSKPAAPKVVEFQGDSSAIWLGPMGDAAAPETQQPAMEVPTSPTAAPAKHSPDSPRTHEAPGADDVLFGGVGEVPFDGVRSPWARSYIGTRLESTMSGSLRVSAGGRWIMRNGFGIEASASLVRAAIANLPDQQNSSGIGNINAALRTPRLQTRHLALQGLVAAVAPISTSFLDSSIEQDPKYVTPGSGGTALAPDARPPGGGWRIEPALLIGVHVRGFSISTMQGVSLRVSPDFGASYAGGLLVHAEIVPMLRFITFAAWEVRYLGSPGGIVNTAAQTPDMGGAIGGGFEALIPAGNLGSLRLAILGRAAIGDGGEAIYGRGAVGFQFGYLFH